MNEPGERTVDSLPLPGGDFRLFITRLSFQGMMSLGLLENPLTRSRQVHLPNARMILDDLRMLREKTSGNLEPDEAGHLDKVIDDLERQFEQVEESGAGV